MDPSNGKDNDVEIIKRDHPEPHGDVNAHHDEIDTPAFMQSFDLPTPQPANPGFFDDLENLKNPHIPSSEFLTPNIGPLSEIVGCQDTAYDNDNDHNYAGALTRYSNPLPPLPPLTEPVIPNIPYKNMAIVPDYVSNGVSQRQQALLGSVKRKKDQGSKTKPAFVVKIWNMVNDPANHDYIRWTDDGQAFLVVHREEFMKLILPNYFKHNNFASFVRQLNMYGWHKVQDITSGTMKESANLEEVLKFKNPDFIRGREDLLDNIVRNKTGGLDENNDSSLVNLHVMTTEVDKLKMTQLAMLEDLRRIRTDNQNLWQEIVNARERERKLSQMIQKIVNFVEAAYGKSAGKIFEVQSGLHEQNYNQQVLTYNNPSKQGYRNPQPSNNNFSLPQPVQRPRLMLMDLAYQKTPADTRSSSITTGKDSFVEEIVRNGDDYDSSNKFLQQFMNQDPVASPRHYFPELNNNYIGTPSQDANDNFLRFEQKLEKHGNDLAHTQEWIDQISKQQQQQQQAQQKTPNSIDSGIDDFMSEILNEPNSEASVRSNQDSLNSSNRPTNQSKRHIETQSDVGTGSSRKRARR